MGLERYSNAELEEELRFRKIQEEEKKKKPQQFEILDLTPLRTILRDYIDEATENNYVSDDFEHNIFETAMNVFYGVDVWDYINEVLG